MASLVSKTTKRLISYVGKVKLEDITPNWRGPVGTFCENAEKEDPRITKAEIKGSEPHKSHDDPTETEHIISVRFKDEADKRIGTAHIRKDGTGSMKRW